MVAHNEVVVTTSAIPGERSPVLVTADRVERMQPGSVIVDLASARGGNCELTKPGETIQTHGVTIVGPLNLASAVPYHASQMYANNITTLLLHLVKPGRVALDSDDEITAGTLVTHESRIVNERVKSLLDEGGASYWKSPSTRCCGVGVEIITKIPPTLHTPLMSGSNAISGITLVGSVIAAGGDHGALATGLAIAAVAMATVNVVGGFMVTHRMLAMFRKK